MLDLPTTEIIEPVFFTYFPQKCYNGTCLKKEGIRMTEDYLHEIKVFENYEMALFEKRHVVVSSKVVESSLNYYGNAHGGYLFTMCDQVAGLTAISTGFDAVTMQSSINYMRAGRLEDCLTIEGFCVHDGRSTKIIEVTISNQRQEAVAKAIFTMYVTGEHQSKSQKKS